MSEAIENPLGKLLEARRRSRRLTGAAVWRLLAAREIQVDRSFVYRWFRTDSAARLVPFEYFEDLAEILGLSEEDRLEALRLVRSGRAPHRVAA